MNPHELAKAWTGKNDIRAEPSCSQKAPAISPSSAYDLSLSHFEFCQNCLYIPRFTLHLTVTITGMAGVQIG